ncbi:MAG TPA: AAA family ATPase, partial [Pyrinomonadaceae bacterium]|nr:AAA family ATPase [Pyrinomonadaceae bacterium]
VFWRWVERPGKPTKEPYDPHTGNLAKTNRHKTWGTFEQAVTATNTLGGNGVGIVFAEDDTLAGVDLDDCRDPDTGDIDADAQAIIDGLNSYTEVSPSGTGIKVFLHGISGAGKGRNTLDTPWGGKIEMYDHSRFFTVTGDHLAATPNKVTVSQKALADLYRRFFGCEPDNIALEAPYIGLSDDEVLSKVRAAKNGEKFERLYDCGDISEYGYDESSADASLAGILVFYTGDDVEQAARIMCQSALYRAKYDRADYLPRTINYALQQKLKQKEPDFYGHSFVSVTIDNPLKEINEYVRDDDLFQPTPPSKDETNKPAIVFESVDEVLADAGEQAEWYVKNILARSAVTDLTGPAKYAGKTTLITHIMRCVLDGCPFLGEPTTKTNIVYLTEQGNNIAEAIKKAGLDKRNEGLRILRRSHASGVPWPKVVAAALEEVKRIGASILIVDTVNRFAGLSGDKENSAGDVSQAMTPLIDAAQLHNIAVLGIRHANKAGLGRGSTQFEHDVDILLNLKRAEGNGRDNERVLEGVGRYDSIPDKLTIELTEAGYVSRGTGSAVPFRLACEGIRENTDFDPNAPVKVTELKAVVTDEKGVSDATFSACACQARI